MPDLPHLSDAEWLEEVRAAHAVRAEFYYLIFVEMRDAFGEEKALELIAKATMKSGLAQSSKYGDPAGDTSPSDFCKAFCQSGSVGCKIFEIEAGEVRGEGDAEEADAYLGRCALVETWRKMGVSDDLIAKLCRAAHQTDFGKVEGLGLRGEFPELLSEGAPRCRMVVRRKRDKPVIRALLR